MRLLLDTHAFIYWTIRTDRLSPLALSLMQDPGNELFLSLVSLWEMQLKTRLGNRSSPASGTNC